MCPGRRGKGSGEVGLGRASGSVEWSLTDVEPGPCLNICQPMQGISRPGCLSPPLQGPGNGPRVLPPMGKGSRQGRSGGWGSRCHSLCPHPQWIWVGGLGIGAGFCREGAICSDNWCWAAFTQQPACLGRQYLKNILSKLGPAGGSAGDTEVASDSALGLPDILAPLSLPSRGGAGTLPGRKSFPTSDLDPSCCDFSKSRPCYSLRLLFWLLSLPF